jgi:hypothetical protein
MLADQGLEDAGNLVVQISESFNRLSGLLGKRLMCCASRNRVIGGGAKVTEIMA